MGFPVSESVDALLVNENLVAFDFYWIAWGYNNELTEKHWEILDSFTSYTVYYILASGKNSFINVALEGYKSKTVFILF